MPTKTVLKMPYILFCICTQIHALIAHLPIKKALESLRDRPIVWIRSENINFNESSSAYSRDKNYQALMNSMQSNQKHPLYMIVSSNLTPRQRTFCLPIQDFIDPYEATNSIDSIGG